MSNINTIIELEERIQMLDKKQAQEILGIKVEFTQFVENIKPINILKKAFKNIIESPNLKSNILDTTMSVVAGYLSKKVVTGSSENPFRKLIGTIIQTGVTLAVSKNSEGIKSKVTQLLHNILKKRNT